MYKYTCLNPIAEVGLGNLDDNYARTEDFASAGPLPEGLPPPPAAAPALPALSLRVPFGRIRGAQASPRQYREIGQRVARAILSRW